LQITDEALGSMNDYTDKISSTSASVPIQENNEHTGMSKSMVPDIGWFNRNRMKFEDWWKEIQLFLKSNRVIKTNDRITAILAYLRGGVAGIYT